MKESDHTCIVVASPPMSIYIEGLMRQLLTTVVLLLALACGGEDRAEAPGPAPLERPAAPAAGQREWVEIDGVEFPAAMAEAPQEVKDAYVFAAKHPEVLKYMPCYCGCENPRFSHESNYDCFVDAIDTTGQKPRVDPDPMGFG